MKTELNYQQQGDVLIGEVVSLPDNVLLVQTNVLQEGEHTGHAHRLYNGDFQVYETPTKEKYLKIVTPTMLRHEEHKAFEINPGIYKIGIIKEYDPFEKIIRRVQD